MDCRFFNIYFIDFSIGVNVQMSYVLLMVSTSWSFSLLRITLFLDITVVRILLTETPPFLCDVLSSGSYMQSFKITLYFVIMGVRNHRMCIMKPLQKYLLRGSNKNFVATLHIITEINVMPHFENVTSKLAEPFTLGNGLNHLGSWLVFITKAVLHST